jgi:hypothetical protein
MSTETLLRLAAVAAAVVLLAAPYAEHFRSVAVRGVEFLRAHAGLLARAAAAGLIAAWGRIPLPSMLAAAPAVTVEAPTAEMQALVAPIGRVLGPLPAAEGILWASVWSKAALVVETPGTGETQVLADTPALRLFTVVALDVAWRRLGGHAPGSIAGLKTAVEAAMNSALGTEAVPVTAELRSRYAEVARAIAWAGLESGG